MGKKSYNWVEIIQRGKGKDVSRFFFDKFTTEEEATIKFHRKAHKKNSKKRLNPWAKKVKRYKKIHYVDKNISGLCIEWERNKFLEKINVPLQRRIMTLNPFYRYCEELYKIKFTQEEKTFIDKLFDPYKYLRWVCLFQHPNDDIINAILKFYVKYFPMSYNELYRTRNLSKDSNERLNKQHTEIIKSARQEAKNFLRKGISNVEEAIKSVKYYKKLEKEKDENKRIIKIALFEASLLYCLMAESNPKFIASIDYKFMKILGVIF